MLSERSDPADRRRPCAARPAAALALAALLAGPAPLAAQATLTTELGAVGANALVGALTGGVAAWVRGGEFAKGFATGAAGGALQYAGKRISATDLAGAGLAGRLVGATGASVIRNAGAGVGALDRLFVPVGPVTVAWAPARDSGRVRLRLNVGRAVFLGRLVADDGLRLDWGRTLSAGAPVFVAPGRVIEGEGGSAIGGLEMWGTISLSDPAIMPPMETDHLLAHERIHVVQDEFLYIAWADPLEDWLLRRVPGGATVERHADLGITYMVVAGAMILALPYDVRPWEVEAAYMDSGW